MVYGETGRYPLYVTIFTRMVSYWAKLVNGTDNKLSKIIYMYVRKLSDKGKMIDPWISFLQSIFDKCGLSNIWIDHGTQNFNSMWIKKTVHQRLRDQFLQKWHDDIVNSSKGIIYRIFKTNFECEEYFSLLPQKLQRIFVKFRTTNHHLPVEVGRWVNTERNERFCTLCNCNEIGDEFHYILECKSLSKLRREFLDIKFCSAPNTKKFSDLMSSKNPKILRKLCLFIMKINNIICSPNSLSV